MLGAQRLSKTKRVEIAHVTHRVTKSGALPTSPALLSSFAWNGCPLCRNGMDALTLTASRCQNGDA